MRPVVCMARACLSAAVPCERARELPSLGITWQPDRGVSCPPASYLQLVCASENASPPSSFTITVTVWGYVEVSLIVSNRSPVHSPTRPCTTPTTDTPLVNVTTQRPIESQPQGPSFLQDGSKRHPRPPRSPPKRPTSIKTLSGNIFCSVIAFRGRNMDLT